MKILLIYPEYPNTFWSFKYALKFISKKASSPPLGLLSVSSILPENWDRKLIDMNVEKLKDQDILWADYTFISAMSVQIKSVKEVIHRCQTLNKIIVAGGPLFTEEYESFEEVDHLILNEAEITLPEFISDLAGSKAKKLYQTDRFPDIKSAPVPDYSLIKPSKYASLSIQYSRGCPFNCEFCDITALFGQKVRTKSTEQIISELNHIYNSNFRGNVFFVDDNFIGNKKQLKNELLPAMINWMLEKKHPFNFTTEASINLSDDPELMLLMERAGFTNIFVGIETPEEICLEECNKAQNRNRNLLDSVKRIQNSGMEVTAGFIVGFDQDQPNIFQRQIDFIQSSGIVTAMVGLLNAPKKTKLYKRLQNEGRIEDHFGGDNTNYSMNFQPKMKKEDLINGYQKIINGIYSCKPFYERVLSFIEDFEPRNSNKTSVSFIELIAFIKSLFILGIFDPYRKYYWKLLFWSVFNKPRVLPLAITYSIYGYHFRKVFKQ